MSEAVNHPAHYNQFPVEVIEIAEHLDFCLGNVVKYVTRAPFKGEYMQDLKKAKWYLDRAIQREEKNELRTQKDANE